MNDVTAPLAGAAIGRIVSAVGSLLDSASPDSPPTLTSVCDVLWLASHLPPRRLPVPSGPVTAETAAPAGPTGPAAATLPRPARPTSPNVPRSVFPRSAHGRGTVLRTGHGAALPAVAPLPEALALGRALRPLRLRRRSRSRQLVDEAATAFLAARTGTWRPVLRPCWERWPDVALVMDGSPSMAIWREEVLGFYEVLRQVAAFRNVRGFRLTGSDDGPRVSTRLTVPADESGQNARAVPALRDPTGRRLTVLVTDGVDAAWGSTAYRTMLHDLAATGPVVLVSLLPHRLWPAGGLRARPGRIRADLPLQPNAGWRCRPVDEHDTAPAPAIPIPVLDLSPSRFVRAAGVLTGGSAWTRMRLLADPIPASPADKPATPVDWAPFLRSFLSPGAYRLLLVMAVIPEFLSISTIRAVQRRVLPQTGVAELAEVLLSGAFQPPDSAFADGGGRLGFVSEQASAHLLDAAGPALRAAVWQALDDHLDWTGSPGLAQFLVEHPFGHPILTKQEGQRQNRVTLPGPPPVQVPIVREVVSKFAVQSRAVAADALAERELDESGLRLFDADDLVAWPAEGVAALRAAWRDPQTTAVHIDHADRPIHRPELLTVLTGLIRNSVERRGPRIVVLGRRGETDRTHEYPALFTETCTDAGAQHRIDWELEETPALRVYRMGLGVLRDLPAPVEDRLWRGLRGSSFLLGIGRQDVMSLFNLLISEIGRRHRERVGIDRGAPLHTADLPPDIDVFLRSTL